MTIVPTINGISSNATSGTNRVLKLDQTEPGDSWIGLKMNRRQHRARHRVLPVFAGVLGLPLLLGSRAGTWARERRQQRTINTPPAAI